MNITSSIFDDFNYEITNKSTLFTEINMALENEKQKAHASSWMFFDTFVALANKRCKKMNFEHI